MFKKNESNTVTLTKDQKNTLFSIYTDIAGFVEENKDYTDVSKAEKDASFIKEILDQIEGDFEYKIGY